MHPLKAGVEQGLVDLQLSLSAAQVDQLLAYVDLIQKWTKVYNLTAVRDPVEMLTHHLLDSLAVINPLRVQLGSRQPESLEGAAVDAAAQVLAGAVVSGAAGSAAKQGGPRLLDVGSGAGLPGVVIAICCPELTVHCVDTVGKKAAFIQQVAVSLKLPNLRGVHSRVEALTDKYDVVSSRAFASLFDFTSWSVNALAEQGVWMGMKGKHPAEEMQALPASVQVFHVEQLTVPGLNAERCIVWMRPAR